MSSFSDNRVRSLSTPLRLSHSLPLLFALLFALLPASPASAQTARRQRRESNASRQARIARTTAQTYSYRWEAAGGGGYLRVRSGETLQKNNEVTFALSTTYTLSDKVGVTGDIVGAFGNAVIPNNIFNEAYSPQISQYYFTVGPSYRFIAKEKYSISGHVLGGIAYGNFDGGAKGLISPDLHLYESGVKPVINIGVNLDYNLYPNIALRATPLFIGSFWRLANADTTPGSHGSIQSNLGINLGVVYRFGKQR